MLFRCGGAGGVSGISVTLQNNRLGWIEIAGDEAGQGIEDRTDFSWAGSINQASRPAISDTSEFDVGNNESLRFALKTEFDVAPIRKCID